MTFYSEKLTSATIMMDKELPDGSRDLDGVHEDITKGIYVHLPYETRIRSGAVNGRFTSIDTVLEPNSTLTAPKDFFLL